ncbi:MAG: carboxypeptidase regulatory-like domain-containing protein [Nitrospirae bacterium]|nr:carboxypeptidase regulatory-like domain-containing protein [Nitrospirota bacterium]
MTHRLISLAAGMVVCAVWATGLSAYDGVERVEHGGVIKGRVVLSGPVPEPRVMPIIIYHFASYCRKISDGEGRVVLREFHVDQAGGLQDAVVALEDVKTGKRFRYRENSFVATNCMFHPDDVPEAEQFEGHGDELTHVHPLVSVLRNQWPITMTNADPIVHGAQLYQPEIGVRLLSFPLPPIAHRTFGGAFQVRPGKKIVQVICPMHEYMQTWAWVVDNPYYAKTRQGGGYAIDQVPPGTYKITAWHPHMKPITRTVTVPPDGVVSLDFEFDARQVVRPMYETQEQFRITPESNPFENVKGCEGPYCVRRPEHHHDQ